MADYKEYISRKIVKETEKAYLVEQQIANRRDGWQTKFKWVAKKICKPSEKAGEILVPEWAVSNGVW